LSSMYVSLGTAPMVILNAYNDSRALDQSNLF